MVIARSVADFGDLPSRPGWRPADPQAGIEAWTDDYSDLILRKKLAD